MNHGVNHGATHYDSEDLQRLLDDALPEPLAGEVAEHVADCPDCRAHLEGLAGQPNWWSQACDGVKAILDDPAAYSSTGDELPAGAHGLTTAAHDDSFAATFAIDFLEPTDEPGMLGRLGDYEILEVIGRGGMGIVLKGFQRELNRYVAVKVLAPHLALSAAARRRFAREAQATAAVVHPHVMAIHAVAANARLPYLVMAFVACESLQQRLDRHGPLDAKDVLRIGLQAANGLAAAHAQGLVHRDIKPANILLETSVDRVMLTDFGLARAVDDATLTRTGIIAGTPQYMSPEQANGDAVDHRSDLFSLGSVLYAMCTGRPPFRAETTFGVLRRIRETSPRPIREINADVPDWLEAVVLKLLSKEAAERIGSATEVAALLEQCLAHLQQPTTVALPETVAAWTRRAAVPEPQPIVSAPSGRRPVRWVVGSCVVLAVIALGVFWPPAKPAVTTNPATGSANAPSTLDPQLEWEAMQTGLDESAATIDALEAMSQQELDDLESNPTPPADIRGKDEP